MYDLLVVTSFSVGLVIFKLLFRTPNYFGSFSEACVFAKKRTAFNDISVDVIIYSGGTKVRYVILRIQ